MDDRPFTVTLAKEDWNIVLKILEICKETTDICGDTKSNALSAK